MAIDILRVTTITPLMGTQISHKRRKCTNWGRCSYQQHSSENIFGRQRGEKGMDTRGSSNWWTRTWSRVKQHQTVWPSQMGGQQGAGVHGGEVVRVQVGTRRHRRKRRRGSGDGARGQQRLVVGIDGWSSSGVFTHIVLRVHLRAHLHKWVDERQSPIGRREVK